MVQPAETVTRPDPGLARGTWEAPAWALWLMLAVVLIGATLYLLRRVGVLRRPASAKKPGDGGGPGPKA